MAEQQNASGATTPVGPVPTGGVGSQDELKQGAQTFRTPQTIPPTQDVLDAAAAGDKDTVKKSASLAAAVAAGGGIAAAIGLRGGAGEKLEEWPCSYDPKPGENTVVHQGESGHLFEADDTRGKERISLYHTHGSHIEFLPEGRVKYKTVSDRQDVTKGAHEFIVEGDCKISIDKSYVLNIRGGELTIETASNAKINVKGELKLSASSMELKAENHIFLNAPKVDIGAIAPGGMPLMSLPAGITVKSLWPPDMTFIPRVNIPLSAAGMGALKGALKVKDSRFDKVKKTLGDIGKSAPSGDDIGLTNIFQKVADTIRTVVKLPKTITQLAAAAAGLPPIPNNVKVAAAILKALKEGAVDASGQPAFSKLNEQPETIALSNPFLYQPSPELVAARGRTFDTPEDIANDESYSAHINLSVELNDYTQEARTSPGTATRSDTAGPSVEPHPATAFPLTSGGRVAITTGETVVLGTNTVFSEDLEEGQTIIINTKEAKINTIVNNTALILSAPWSEETETSAEMQSYRFRPMKEYFGTFKYEDSAALGSSGLSLSDFFVNFKSPIIEVPRVNTAMLAIAVDAGLVGGEGNECGKPGDIPNAFGTVREVYNRGGWDLSTDEGGGEFVDAVVQALGPEWGHINKTAGQTQHNGHAVDAIMYKSSTALYNGKSYQAVDIIAAHGSDDAAVAWQPVCEPDDGSRWKGKG